MSFSKLTDDCLLGIFDNLNLKSLISRAPLVCRRWTTLQSTAFHRRKSLSIQTGPTNNNLPMELSQSSSHVRTLVLEGFTRSKVISIVKHFPNLTNVGFILNNNKLMHSMHSASRGKGACRLLANVFLSHIAKHRYSFATATG